MLMEKSKMILFNDSMKTKGIMAINANAEMKIIKRKWEKYQLTRKNGEDLKSFGLDNSKLKL